MKKGLKTILIIAVLMLAAVAASVASLYISKYTFGVTEYRLQNDRASAEIRIVQITDLHMMKFGEDNADLLAAVRDAKPDLIFLTGDLINADDANTDTAMALVRNLSGIAPVYASYGNHEQAHEFYFGSDMRALYEENGAVWLQDEYRDISINGCDIRIGGTYLSFSRGSPFMKRFQDTDSLRLLLCHMPATWESMYLDVWDVDYIFSGHAHGGQVRFPLVGGLYDPETGWFPGRISGLYYSEDEASTLILSRGLGSSGRVPRFNNRPELVLAVITPKSK